MDKDLEQIKELFTDDISTLSDEEIVERYRTLQEFGVAGFEKIEREEKGAEDRRKALSKKLEDVKAGKVDTETPEGNPNADPNIGADQNSDLAKQVAELKAMIDSKQQAEEKLGLVSSALESYKAENPNYSDSPLLKSILNTFDNDTLSDFGKVKEGLETFGFSPQSGYQDVAPNAGGYELPTDTITDEHRNSQDYWKALSEKDPERFEKEISIHTDQYLKAMNANVTDKLPAYGEKA